MKKLLSSILAVVMVLSSMAMVVSANEADLTDGIYVGTTKYDTFTAAQTAAAETSAKEIIISGTVEFGSRQGISVANLHLRGINDAKIIPSATYGNSTSDTNKKGLLNIAAEGVKVTDITFDGSVYGDTLATPAAFDFKVLRVNSGSAYLENVTITGSKRALLMVGTTTSEATVTAKNLYLYGETKTVSGGETYADLEVADGSVSIDGGVMNAYIISTTANPVTITNTQVYEFVSGSISVFTTPRHIADTYLDSMDNATATEVNKYASLLTDNSVEATEMINDIVDANDAELAADLKIVMNDMLNRKYKVFGIEIGYVVSNDSDRALLNTLIGTLDTIIPAE